MMCHLGKNINLFSKRVHGDRWVGNVNIRLQKCMKKVAKTGGFRVVLSSFLHNTQHICNIYNKHFYCLNRLILD